MSRARKRSERGARPTGGQESPRELVEGAPRRGARVLLAASGALFSLWFVWLLLLALFG